ncbi:hypothetical protein MTP99_011554 [Tenebrio molitor]|jgi:hypothetical protein|nr:hypothetical protein MTP99_011554 [Tenebrio molitor]
MDVWGDSAGIGGKKLAERIRSFFPSPTSGGGGGGLIEGRTIMNGSERVAFPVQIIAADYTWFLPEITVVAGAAWLR